uniref:SIAH-type domain-containing protein n=1 Tax=Cucumis melo TaxID=3656 RepID=A0A9I9DME9_CUCME
MDLNLINDQETLCRYEPCSCPLDNCTFVGLAEQLYLHFSRRHKNSAKHFSYNTRFTICLNNGDTYRILKAEDDGVLFFLSYTFEIFGNAITGSVLSLQSIAKEIQSSRKVPPSNGLLLIPNEYFGSSTQTILEIRIWPAH